MKLNDELKIRAQLSPDSSDRIKKHKLFSQFIADKALANLNQNEQDLNLQAGGPPSDGGPGSGNYPHKKHGSALPDKDLEDKFRGELRSDWEGAKAKYRAKFGRTLSADDAKELSTDYNQDRGRAMAVHEPASELVKALYEEELKKPAPKGLENTVVFTAGAPGAGKTTATKSSPAMSALSNHAQIVYDGTFANPESASKKINQALSANKNVTILYVHRDPVEAFRNGVLKRAGSQELEFGSGRVVPIDEAADQHAKIQASMAALRERYKDNPLVQFQAFDNSRGPGQAKPVPFDQVAKITDTKDQLASKMKVEAQKAYMAGDISKKIFKDALHSSLGKHT